MRNQKFRCHTSAKISHQRMQHFSLCSWRKKEDMVQGKLRIRSIPGAFLVLGMVVVIIGTALAVAGYWPCRVQRSLVDIISDHSQTSRWGVGAKELYSIAGLIHNERMKLLGPVIMGVGLFILICANTVLYENRDRETQMLLAQTPSVICSVSAAIPSIDLIKVNSMAKHYQWVSSLPASQRDILSLKNLVSSELLLQDKATEEEGSQQKTVVFTDTLHQDPSTNHSNHTSCKSSKKVFSTALSATQQSNCTCEPQTKSQYKLKNCLTSSSMFILEGESWELGTFLPRRCHSLSCRTNLYTLPRDSSHLEESAVLSVHHHNMLPPKTSSDVFVKM